MAMDTRFARLDLAGFLAVGGVMKDLGRDQVAQPALVYGRLGIV